MSTVLIRRPVPNPMAQRGLQKIKSIEVDFDPSATENHEAAALAYLNDLIAWWQMPSKAWITTPEDPTSR